MKMRDLMVVVVLAAMGACTGMTSSSSSTTSSSSSSGGVVPAADCSTNPSNTTPAMGVQLTLGTALANQKSCPRADGTFYWWKGPANGVVGEKYRLQIDYDQMEPELDDVDFEVGTLDNDGNDVVSVFPCEGDCAQATGTGVEDCTCTLSQAGQVYVKTSSTQGRATFSMTLSKVQ